MPPPHATPFHPESSYSARFPFCRFSQGGVREVHPARQLRADSEGEVDHLRALEGTSTLKSTTSEPTQREPTRSRPDQSPDRNYTETIPKPDRTRQDGLYQDDVEYARRCRRNNSTLFR